MSAVNVFDALRDAWIRECQITAFPAAEVWYCHRTPFGNARYEWFSGLRALGWHLAQRTLTGAQQSPILLAGGHDWNDLKRWAADDPPLGALLDWPGLAYLPFGAGRGLVVAAVKRAGAGIPVPVPAALAELRAAHISEILNASRLVRHWLGNKLRTIRLTVSQLHASHLVNTLNFRPQEGVSPDHHGMVAHLSALVSSSGLSPGADAPVVRLHEALGNYEQAWVRIEHRRAELATAALIRAPEENLVQSFITDMNQTISLLERAVESTNALDCLIESESK